MDAGTLSIKTIFGQDRRHLVPLFQRPYVWTRDQQWEALWDDIRNVADRLLVGQAARPHFLGAVVLDQVRKPTGHIECRLVIDGQQRLTTIQLLLEAFGDNCGRLQAEKHRKALVKLTRNDDPMSEDADEQFKIWPTNVDQEHFRRVMLANGPEDLLGAYGAAAGADGVGNGLADAYLFFHRCIAEWLGNTPGELESRVEALYRCLREYLRMVVIDLADEDDAQLIFETLNARGTPLLPSDLVKNHLFHRAQVEKEPIEQLYKASWQRFDAQEKFWREELGRGHAKRARIDIFLQHYLTLKMGDDVAVAHLYGAFQQWVRSQPDVRAREHLESLAAYAKTYQQFDEMPAGSRERLFFERLASMEITTAYPFLLEVFAKHGKERAAVLEVLGYLESFLVRRMICQLNTRGYNHLFIELLKSVDGPSAGLAKRVREALAGSTAESNRWPRDREFLAAWLDVPVYDRVVQQRVRMVLEGLERQMQTGLGEKLSFEEKLTIEHLLPQEWRPHWPLPPTDDPAAAELARNRALHTFGNLTLLTKKLNPVVSNGPWATKRETILDHTLLTMNKQLKHATEWHEAAIRERGEQLFEHARAIWPAPEA